LLYEFAYCVPVSDVWHEREKMLKSQCRWKINSDTIFVELEKQESQGSKYARVATKIKQ